jgi:hypothetical protein
VSRPVKGATFLGFAAALAVSRSPLPVATPWKFVRNSCNFVRSFPADPAVTVEHSTVVLPVSFSV